MKVLPIKMTCCFDHCPIEFSLLYIDTDWLLLNVYTFCQIELTVDYTIGSTSESICFEQVRYSLCFYLFIIFLNSLVVTSECWLMLNAYFNIAMNFKLMSFATRYVKI